MSDAKSGNWCADQVVFQSTKKSSKTRRGKANIVFYALFRAHFILAFEIHYQLFQSLHSPRNQLNYLTHQSFNMCQTWNIRNWDLDAFANWINHFSWNVLDARNKQMFTSVIYLLYCRCFAHCNPLWTLHEFTKVA